MSRGFLHLNPTQAIRTGLVQEENNELSGLKTIIIKTPSEYNRTERNWGGQILFEYAQVKVPKTKEELQDAVVSAPGTVRVVGRGLVYITYKMKTYTMNFDNLTDVLKDFKNNHKLNFNLLSDFEKKMGGTYGVNNFYFFPSRKTFLIDENGILVHIIEKVNLNSHSNDILTFFRK